MPAKRKRRQPHDEPRVEGLGYNQVSDTPIVQMLHLCVVGSISILEREKLKVFIQDEEKRIP